MIRQSRTGDAVLVKSREMTEDPNTAEVAGERRGIKTQPSTKTWQEVWDTNFLQPGF
jgi:hypothetical protein